MALRFSPLFSGSSGNAVYVSDGTHHILVDAGVSGTRIVHALQRIGVDPASLSGIFVTHEHSDHIAGVGVLHRKYHLPIFATRGTWEGMRTKVGAINESMVNLLNTGEDILLGQLDILPFATPHDSNESCGYSFDLHGARFSLATDCGCTKYGWTEHVLGSDAVLLESNYDNDMLLAGSYPYELKKRISGNHGHLRNEDAADFAVKLAQSGTSHIVLGHLSKENNLPAIAKACTENALRDHGIDPEFDLRLDVALRDDVTGLFEVESRFV